MKYGERKGKICGTVASMDLNFREKIIISSGILLSSNSTACNASAMSTFGFLRVTSGNQDQDRSMNNI